MLPDNLKTGAVLVKFEAPWCQPCKSIQPTVDALVTAGGGKFRLERVDVDTDADLAQAIGVRGVPAFAAIKDGVILGTQAGASPSALREFIRNTVGA